jgi:hypothetical protein
VDPVAVVVLKLLLARMLVVNLEQPVKETMVEMDSLGTSPFKAPVVVVVPEVQVSRQIQALEHPVPVEKVRQAPSPALE